MRKRLLILPLVLLLMTPVCPSEVLDLSTPVPEAAAPPQADRLAPLSEAPLETSPPMNLDCAAAVLVEAQSGQILFEQNAETPRAVASVTKVMTILLALEAVDQGRVSLEDSVSISANASGMGGSQVLLDTGEAQTVSVLLKSCIVGSANDAAVALAEQLYGSEEMFVRRMNERAGELGLTDTHFVNCTGLPADGQHTTARDVARMSMALFSHDLYYQYSGIWLDEIDHFDGRVTQLTNTNRLIRLYDGCDGGKTGSTKEAGYCLTATARRGDMRLIAVVLGAGTGAARFELASAMFDYGFANYRLYPVAEQGTRIRGGLPVNGGDAASVPLMLNEALTLLVQKGGEQGVSLVPDLPAAVEAPVTVGETVGAIDVVRDGRIVARLPVVVAASVGSRGFGHAFRRVVRRWRL